ncbi:MAG: caspase family protein [Prochloraceae cyanobacterium]
MADMGFERRSFLQQAGLALLTLTLSETGLLKLGDDRRLAPLVKRNLSALAQPTNRKLALLVGINEYSRNLQLSGCVTDVELQRELLIHRFGFNTSDIVTLTDREATRENIETAFIEHLTQQAKTTDVVVFHFSGYGSQVKIPQSIAAKPNSADNLEQVADNEKLMNSLVPTDGILLAKDAPVINSLLEETLLLLAHSLATNKFTMVLDTSYKSQAVGGHLRSRSLPVISQQLTPEELAFQKQLQINYQQALKKARGGIVLRAAEESQVATETAWGGFSAGLFTYALTQYLWQATPASTIRVAIRRTTQIMDSALGSQQQPQLIGVDKQPLFTYYLLPDRTVGAEGFISALEDKDTVEIQLTGVPVTVLNNYGINSCLTLAPRSQAEAITELSQSSSPDTNDQTQDSETVLLQIRSRDGLTAKAKPISKTENNGDQLQVGQLLQESIRVFSRNLGLTVALDGNLQRIERVDATSAFSNITAVSSALSAGEQAADCLFGRVKKAKSEVVDSEAQDSETVSGKETSEEKELLGSYGLFSVGGVPISNTVGVASEAVKSAVRRLIPYLETILAAKLWRLTANEGSSKLGVKATLEIIDSTNQPLLEQKTLRYPERLVGKPYSGSSSLDSSSDDLLVNIPSGSQIQYRVLNYSDRPIYILVLGIDSDGNVLALYSPQSNPSKLKDSSIAPGETLIIPQPSASLNWIVSGAVGIAQIEIICSRAPFENALQALAAKQHLKGEKEQVLELPNPLEVAQALLLDLHQASAVSEEIIGSASDVWALDVNAWATLSFVYRVV